MAEAIVRGTGLQKANGSQTSYIDGMPLHGPETDIKTIKQQVEFETYQRLLGDLRHLEDCTRPYLAFTGGKLGTENHASRDFHLEMLKRYATGCPPDQVL